MGRFYLKVSNIPDTELDKIMKIMERNEQYMLELEKVEKDEAQRRDKMGSQDLEKDKSKCDNSTDYKAQQAYVKKVAELKAKIHSIELSQKLFQTVQHIFVNGLVIKKQIRHFQVILKIQ